MQCEGLNNVINFTAIEHDVDTSYSILLDSC